MAHIDCSMMSDSEVDFIEDGDGGEDSDFDFERENIAPISKRPKAVTKKAAKTKKSANPASNDAPVQILGERSANKDNKQSSAVSTEKSKSKSEKSKTVEQIYQKKSQLEHILLRPDTYSE